VGDASTDVARIEGTDISAPITGSEMAVLYRLADGLSQSGFFRDARQAQQAFAKLIFGRDLGLSATQSMTDIHIVEGKPELSANLQAAKVRASARYDYRILEHDETVCSIEFGPAPAPAKDGVGNWLPWPQAFGVSKFTVEDAKRAFLTKPTKSGAPSMYVKYPRNMLFARAISNGVAWFCPDVMNGIRVYAEGEVREMQQPEEKPPAAESTAEMASEETVDKIREGITLAGITANDLSMELVALGIENVAEPLVAVESLDALTADLLLSRLHALVDTVPVEAEVASDD
jgi:hypothetical protein